jgi:hypothetical protein
MPESGKIKKEAAASFFMANIKIFIHNQLVKHQQTHYFELK